MFYPHLAEIKITRDEPNSVGVVKSVSNFATDIVTRDLLKNPKKKSDYKKKLARLLEYDQRYATAKKFMEQWNEWRDFYLDVGPIKPKTRGQLTSIENIIEMAKENDLNLNLLIATTHRAYKRRKFRPGFSAVIADGIDNYELHHDKVIADVERAEREERMSE